MNDSMDEALILVGILSVRRASVAESQLAKIFRTLESSEKLEIVRLLMQKNVRLASSIAARGFVNLEEQETLLIELLKFGHANAIRQMIEGLFGHRMRGGDFLRILNKHKLSCEKNVELAAYYFVGVRPSAPIALRKMVDISR